VDASVIVLVPSCHPDAPCRDTVQSHNFGLDADDLIVLQLCKYPIQHATLRPALHADANDSGSMNHDAPVTQPTVGTFTVEFPALPLNADDADQ
jgi:hypothetical protein